MNGSLGFWDLHAVPGVLFECRITHDIWSRERFPPGATVVTSFYILLRQESDSEKHTERREWGKKKCVCLDKQCVRVFYLSGTRDVFILTERPKIFLLGSPFISSEDFYQLTADTQYTAQARFIL